MPKSSKTPAARSVALSDEQILRLEGAYLDPLHSPRPSALAARIGANWRSVKAYLETRADWRVRRLRIDLRLLQLDAEDVEAKAAAVRLFRATEADTAQIAAEARNAAARGVREAQAHGTKAGAPAAVLAALPARDVIAEARVGFGEELEPKGEAEGASLSPFALALRTGPATAPVPGSADPILAPAPGGGDDL